MSWGLWLAVAVGAGVGAPARLWVDRRAIAVWGTIWPVGTFVVNVVGCAALGILAGWSAGAGAGPQPDGDLATIQALVGVGFCGSLTTFSGFAAQVLALGHAAGRGAIRRLAGVAYAGLSLAVGIAATAAGIALGG